MSATHTGGESKLDRIPPSLLVYGAYLTLIGLIFVFASEPFLGWIGVNGVPDFWVRLFGVLVQAIGTFCLHAAITKDAKFTRLSVYYRPSTVIWYGVMTVLFDAPWQLLVFGAIDLAFAAWTGVAWTIRSGRFPDLGRIERDGDRFSAAQLSMILFTGYMTLAGLVLYFKPELLTNLISMPEPTDFWVRCFGTGAVLLGAFYLHAGLTNNTPFTRFSVTLRRTMLPWFTLLVVVYDVPWQLIIVGASDFAFSTWTAWALRRS